MFREWKQVEIKGSLPNEEIPFDSENEKRPIKKKLDKRIDHVQKGLKADTLWDDRPIKEASELANLIGDQFDDDTFNIKQELVCTSLISLKC